MFIIGHVSVPVLLFMIFADALGISYSWTHLVALAIFSMLPDFDLVIASFTKKGIASEHREWPSHMPLFFLPFVVWALVSQSLLSWLSVFGIYMHFFLDTVSIGNGIKWLRPFSDKIFVFPKSYHQKVNGKEWWLVYKKSFNFKIEIGCALAVIVLLLI